jgi:hypothetical protein
MVEVPVGQQYGCRPQMVLAQEVSQLPCDTYAGVDDQAFLTCGWSKDITVGAGHNGRESDGQHACEPNRDDS